jgi:hypothetical protein
VNQFYRRKPRTNIWPDIVSRFAPVKLVHLSGASYWFAVCAGKIGSPVSRFITTDLDIEVDPQRCRFGSRKSDFALQALVECSALEPK